MFPRLLVCGLAVILVACGTPGAPQPPSLRLPKPVEDLRAVRQGDKVILTWTSPSVTTDDGGIRGAATARICRSLLAGERECRDKAADIPSLPGQKATFTDDLTPLLQSARQDFVSYNVEVLNDRGRSAGPSNAVTILLAPSMTAPQNVSAQLDRNGVTISWTGTEPPPAGALRAEYRYRVLRSVAGEASAETVVGEAPARAGSGSFTDRNFQWERRYAYRVAGVTRVLSRDGRVLGEFEGDPGARVVVNAHDSFPPAAPRDLQAVYSGVETQRSIDLTWTPNDDADLAGYHVYRREGAGNFARISSEAARTPSFRDTNVQPGRTYTYSVTAVDERGNESQSSQPASEGVPQ